MTRIALIGDQDDRNPAHRGIPPALELAAAALGTPDATDADGDIRGLELEGHPFYVITLFQPERAALRGVLPPIVGSFVEAASAAG